MEFKHPKYYAELRAERRKQQAASVKPQAEATSDKQQAQPTVVLKKKIIDNASILRYTGIITDGNARHAQLNASPSIPPGSMPVSPSQVPCNSLKKVWGKAVASPEVGIQNKKNLSVKQQAEDTSDTSNKPQAPSSKHQASSRKQQAAQ
jgi:hypothetical protein